jgi:hypothetical protein
LVPLSDHTIVIHLKRSRIRGIRKGRAIEDLGGTVLMYSVVALLYHTSLSTINKVHNLASLGIVVIWNSVAKRRELSVKIVPLQSSFSSLADLDHTSPAVINTSCIPASPSTTAGRETMV